MTGVVAEVLPSSPSATAVRALEATAARDVAIAALVAGVALGTAVGDVLAVLPPLLAGIEIVVRRPGPRVLSPAVRMLVVFASVGYAFGPGGDALHSLSRFLGAIVALTLFEGRTGRERGMLFLLFVAQTGLAAALLPGLSILGVLVAMVVLLHRALAGVHRARGARLALARGGVVVLGPNRRAWSRASHRGAFAVLLVASVIFPILPRAEAPLFALRAPRMASFAGVADVIRLGPIGPLGDLETVVGRASPPRSDGEDAPPYLRAAVYDRFDGREWSVPARIEGAAPIGERGRFEFTAATPGDADAPWRLEIDASIAARVPLPEGTVAGEFAEPLPDGLRADTVTRTLRARVPVSASALDVRVTASDVRAGPATLDARARARWTELPPQTRTALTPLVAEVLGGPLDARTTADRLARWVRDRCAYSLTGAPSGPRPIEDFLLRDRRGHCEYFASALAVCLRCASIPARVVGGYRPTRWNAVGGFWAIRGRDAHAWVEAHVAGVGWVRFDATPASALEPDPYEGILGFLARLRDAAAQVWSSQVLGFDRSAQQELVAAIASVVAERTAATPPGWGHTLAVGALALGIVGVVVFLWRRRKGIVGRRLYSASRSRVGFYSRALDIARRRGAPVKSTDAALETVARAAGALTPAGARAFAGLTTAYLGVRFGAHPVPAPDVFEAWLSDMAASDDPPVGAKA